MSNDTSNVYDDSVIARFLHQMESFSSAIDETSEVRLDDFLHFVYRFSIVRVIEDVHIPLKHFVSFLTQFS